MNGSRIEPERPWLPRLWWIVLGLTCGLPCLGRSAEPEPAAAPSAFRRSVEAVQKAAHAHPDQSPAYYAELERGFRDLQQRFPDEPEVYAELLFVADHTPGPAATSLTRSILEWPAPESVKAKARGVLRKKEALNQVYSWAGPDLDGRTIRLADLKGKVVLIDFWATWCPPCRERLPELKALYERRRAAGFEILGISFDDDLAVLRRFVGRERIGWIQVADGRGWSGPRAAEFGITSLPALWLVDRQGRLRAVEIAGDLAVAVERLLAEPADIDR